MSDRIYVIVDKDERRRLEVYRAFTKTRFAIPVEGISGLGGAWPESARFLVHDDDDLLMEIHSAFATRGCFHPVFVYSERLVPSRIVNAIHGGAVDYVIWPNSVDAFERGEEKIGFLTVARSQKAAARVAAKAQLSLLTSRENEILGEVRLGKTNKQIARDLGISPRTVEVHRGNAFAKIGAKNSADAMRILYEAEEGIVPLYKAA